ncbi:MAG: hemolysin family protein, partial [Alphaproteobacteria bacterium]|nr:hemolysin family protein [Alphaproteobacteria bacterium]
NGEATVREAIEELIDESGDAGAAAIDADERALITNILRLHEATAEDVMVPRAEIIAVESRTSLEELVERMSAEAHSRIPVYRGKLDDVIGFVHIKDVLAALHKKSHRTVADLVRNILFAAPSIQVLDLLLEMRAARVHMAIVVDEYGGVDGLVTIEDLVEEIVGEIEDEHDEDGPLLAERGDGSILADATVRIEELEELVGPFATAEEREEIETLGGIVFSAIDRVPRRAEVIAHPSGLEFEVVEADARRIKKLRILRPGRTAASDAAE